MDSAIEIAARLSPWYTHTLSTVIQEVEAFRQYVLEHSQSDAAGASLEDLFQRWFASRLAKAELEQSLQSLKRGLADADAGRLVDAEVAIQETRARFGGCHSSQSTASEAVVGRRLRR